MSSLGHQHCMCMEIEVASAPVLIFSFSSGACGGQGQPAWSWRRTRRWRRTETSPCCPPHCSPPAAWTTLTSRLSSRRSSRQWWRGGYRHGNVCACVCGGWWLGGCLITVVSLVSVFFIWMTGIFLRAAAVTQGVEWMPKWESAQKVDSGEGNSAAGNRTCELPIRNRALSHQAVLGPTCSTSCRQTPCVQNYNHCLYCTSVILCS